MAQTKKAKRVLMEGKVRLCRVKSKHKKNVRDWIHKRGGVMFDEIAAILSKGSTNVAVLDLNGNPTTVMADAVGVVPYHRRGKAYIPTKLERRIQSALEQNEIEVDISMAQALAMLGRTHYKPENLLKKYRKGPKKSGS
jgi:hypothetical protein